MVLLSSHDLYEDVPKTVRNMVKKLHPWQDEKWCRALVLSRQQIGKKTNNSDCAEGKTTSVI